MQHTFREKSIEYLYGERRYIVLHWVLELVSVTFSQKKTHIYLLSLEESVA